MLAEEGGLSCSFNQTVSVDTLDQVKDTMAWAQQYPDLVHTMVFILFRTPELAGDFEAYANGQPVDVTSTYERPEWGGDSLLKAKDVVAKIHEFDPDYKPCAYLSGDQDPNATKWLLASRLASKKRGFGYVGPRFMEAIQSGHHFFKGTWLSYSPPKSNRMGRSTMSFFSMFDSRPCGSTMDTKIDSLAAFLRIMNAASRRKLNSGSLAPSLVKRSSSDVLVTDVSV